ncbi:unnamed protein product, partial [Mesorhabditis belari]
SGQTIDRIPFIGHPDDSNRSSHRHPFICQCTARNISMSSVKEESKPVVSKAGKKRVHRRQRAKEQRTADSDRSNDEDESARETAAGKKRRQNPMLQTLKFARLRNVARRVIKKLLNKQKDFPRQPKFSSKTGQAIGKRCLALSISPKIATLRML